MNTKPGNLILNSDGALPPLPDTIPSFPEPTLPHPFPFPPPLPLRSVRCGCYLISYKPNGSPLVMHDGTLRVECHSEGRTASGDLYQRPFRFVPGFPPIPVLSPGPDPAAGIPILPRSRYRYYLRVTNILESFTVASSFTLGFEMYRFTAPSSWVNEGTFTAIMTWKPAPPDYPSSGNYLEGDVKNSAGVVVGKLAMGWISEYLRKATVEVDRVPASEAPLNNGAGIDWKSIFREVGWDLAVDVSSADVVAPSGESWSDAELHQAMLARRDASDLDAEWRYHVLAVRKLDSTERGLMYDWSASDSNNVPREGVGISSHWMIPSEPTWGLVRGMRFGSATAPYFRTAVHEIGHAMNLIHPRTTVGNYFMKTTPHIAASGTLATPFPNNISWSFHREDQKRLRHHPDIWVRPGITAFFVGTYPATPPLPPTDMTVEVEELKLRVSPLLDSVPLGAPVRVNMELINTSDKPVFAPTTLSMKSGLVRGTVTDPSGSVRTFLPLVRCVEEHPVGALDPGQRVSHSITLLRGAQGALFPMPGAYRITVEAHWDNGGLEASVNGEAHVMVASAVDEAHAEAALEVLTTPDTLLTLVLGGDHLMDGVEAIQTALENPVLRPHFAYIEAKRLAERFGKRKANLKSAAELIGDSTVMSPAEIKKAEILAKAEGADSAYAKSIARKLKSKAKAVSGEEDLVDALS